MDEKQYTYEISRPDTGNVVHSGVLWAHDKHAAIDSAFVIARMYGVQNAMVLVQEIKLEVVK